MASGPSNGPTATLRGSTAGVDGAMQKRGSRRSAKSGERSPTWGCLRGRSPFNEDEKERDSIYFQKENLNIFQEDGKPNPFLNIFISCLSFSASAELEAIQSRLRSGREKYIRGGGRLGKPKGSGVKTKEMLSIEYKSVIRNLKLGQSVRNTAKITGVSQSTVQRIKKTFGL